MIYHCRRILPVTGSLRGVVERRRETWGTEDGAGPGSRGPREPWGTGCQRYLPECDTLSTRSPFAICCRRRSELLMVIHLLAGSSRLSRVRISLAAERERHFAALVSILFTVA